MPARAAIALAALLAAAAGCGGRQARASAGPEPLAAEYRAWLDDGRVPASAVAFALARAPGFEPVDAFDVRQRSARPGQRLVFVDRGRAALFVVVGERPLADAGARLIVGHIDTPGPKLRAGALVDDAGQARLVADRYGGARAHHWPHVPLALVGHVARVDGQVVPLALGLDDGYGFYIVDADDGALSAVAASIAGETRPAARFVAHLRARYGIGARDLEAAELYLVPSWRAREVGVDRALIGGHGQDDRVNSYAAWRAIADLEGAPERTALVWLVDREEIGSTGPTGARSRFLELVYAWLLRAQGAPATEATLGRALSATRALSSDTPAALNPNFPEAHVARIAPVLGGGPVMYPYAGHDGKQGSHTARAEIIAEVRAAFEAAGAPLQLAELGRVEAGGGGTVSKYLAERGIDIVDLGIPVVSIHSPFELASKQDLWWGYLGYRRWLSR